MFDLKLRRKKMKEILCADLLSTERSKFIISAFFISEEQRLKNCKTTSVHCVAAAVQSGREISSRVREPLHSPVRHLRGEKPPN